MSMKRLQDWAHCPLFNKHLFPVVQVELKFTYLMAYFTVASAYLLSCQERHFIHAFAPLTVLVYYWSLYQYRITRTYSFLHQNQLKCLKIYGVTSVHSWLVNCCNSWLTNIYSVRKEYGYRTYLPHICSNLEKKKVQLSKMNTMVNTKKYKPSIVECTIFNIYCSSILVSVASNT